MRKKCSKLLAGVLSTAMIFSASAIQEKQAAAKVGLNKKTMTLYAGGPVSYKKALLYLADGETEYTPKFYTWDEKVATITEDGVVTAKGVGQTKLVASSKGDNYVCQLTVKKFVYPSTGDFKISTDSPTMKAGEKMTVHATIKATVKGFTYKSTDTKILTVSDKGVITAKASGTAKVKVSTKAKVKNGKSISKYIIIKVSGNKKPTATTPANTTTPKPTKTPEASVVPSATPSNTPAATATPSPTSTVAPTVAPTATPTPTGTKTPDTKIHQTGGNTVTIDGEYSTNASDYEVTYNGAKTKVNAVNLRSDAKGVELTLAIDSMKTGCIIVNVKKTTMPAIYVLTTEEEKIAKMEMVGSVLKEDVDFDKTSIVNGQTQYAAGYHIATIEYKVLNQFGQRMNANINAYCTFGSTATADGGDVTPCKRDANGIIKVKVNALYTNSGKVILINPSTEAQVVTDVILQSSKNVVVTVKDFHIMQIKNGQLSPVTTIAGGTDASNYVVAFHAYDQDGKMIDSTGVNNRDCTVIISGGKDLKLNEQDTTSPTDQKWLTSSMKGEDGIAYVTIPLKAGVITNANASYAIIIYNKTQQVLGSTAVTVAQK